MAVPCKILLTSYVCAKRIVKQTNIRPRIIKLQGRMFLWRRRNALAFYRINDTLLPLLYINAIENKNRPNQTAGHNKKHLLEVLILTHRGIHDKITAECEEKLLPFAA